MSTYRRRDLPLYANTENCSNRTFIVTGANTGLGFEVSKHLVAAGAAKVVMAVRNVPSGEDAKAKIEAETGKSRIAEVWPIDMASYTSVKAFATKATGELDRVDALIENAGVFDFKRIMAECHLNTVTVNIISTFLLAVLMLPKLSQTAREFEGAVPHLSVVGSSYGFSDQKGWELFKGDPLVKMDPRRRISRNYILVTRQLGILLPLSQTGVVINAVSPGLSVTGLGRSAPPEFQEMMAARAEDHGRTAEEGSRTLLHAALAGKESHGRYLESCEIAEDRLPGWMTDAEGQQSQKRAWDVVVAELDAIEPGCVKKLLKAT